MAVNRGAALSGLPSNILDDLVRMRVTTGSTGTDLDSSFDLAVALGQVDGAYSLTKFGANTAAPSGVKIDVWDAGGTYVFLDTAETLSIYSSDANDDISGTGARTVEIFGLDAGYNEISETVQLAGTVLVPTVNEYIRCNRMIVRSAGSNGSAIGTIKADTSGGNTQTQLVNGFNQSQMAIWTVPAGKTAVIKYTEASIGKGKEGLFELTVRPFGEVFQTKKVLKVFEKKSATPRVYGTAVTEKSDIKISVTSDSPNAFVVGEFECIVLDNQIFGL